MPTGGDLFGGAGDMQPLDVPKPAQAPPTKRDEWKRLAPLLALLPMVAQRGGRAGVAALLHGFQSQRQQQGQLERQAMLDARAGEQQDWQRQIQQANLANLTTDNARAAEELALRRQAAQDAATKDLYSRFQTGIQSDDLESPEAMNALLQFFQAEAQARGVNPDPLSQAAARITPEVFSRRQLKKGVEQAETLAAKMKAAGSEIDPLQMTVQIDGQHVPYRDAVQMLRGVGLPATTPGTAPAGTSDLARALARYAAARGKRVDELTWDEEVAARRELDAASRDPRQPYVPIIVMGPNGPLMVDRTTGTGTPLRSPDGGTIGPNPSSAERMAVAESEASLTLIGDIEQKFQPHFVGPAVGPLTRAQMATPGLPDVSPEVASFYASVSSLRNEIIKLMSGAAVSGSEEQRMRQQIPDVNQKPNVFKANLAATKRNREELLRRISARVGMTPAHAVSAPVAPASPPPNPYRRPAPR